MPSSKRKTKGHRRPMKRRNNSSIDKDTQNARLESSVADSLTWSILSDPTPRYGRVGRFDNKVFNVIQSVDQNSGGTPVPIFSTSTTVPTFYAASFTFQNQVPQYASWAGVFDQYRIMEVEAWIRPVPGTSGTVDTNGANMLSVLDYDDAATPTQVTNLSVYENCITTPLTNGQYRKFRPHVAIASYQGAFSGYTNIKSPWIDVGSTGVQHFGLKIAVETTSTVYKIFVAYRVWIQFRNVF